MSLFTNHQVVTAQCVLLVVVIFGYDKVNSQGTCGAVGHSDQTEYSRLTNLQFYLNTQNSAPCSGTVTSWEYCYYNSTDVPAGEYRAPFGIYRLNRNNNYDLVSDLFVIIISNATIGSSSFTCGTFTVPSVTTIHQGDVVGVCINDLNDGTQAHLNLVGSSNTSDSLHVSTSNNICNDGGMEVVLPGSVINRGSNRLSLSASTVLHLYANIATVSSPTTVQATTGATTETPTTVTVETTTESPTTMSQPSNMVTTSSLTTAIESTSDTQTTVTLPPTTVPATTESTAVASTTDQTMSLSSHDDTTMGSQTTATEGPETTDATTTITTRTEPSPKTSDTPTETTITESDTESSSSSPNSTTSEDTTTPSVTTTDNTMAPSVIGDTGDTNIAPILGSVLAMFLLLVLMIAAGWILCLVWAKKRKFRSVYNIHRSSRANSPGFDNVNYQPYGGNDPSLTSEQANGSHHHYDLAGPEKMDSFIYSGSYNYDEVMSSTSEYQQNTSTSTRRGVLFTNPCAQVMDEPDDKTRTLSYLEPYDEVMSGAVSPLDGSVVSYAELLEKNERDDTCDDSNPYCVPPELEEEIYGQIRTCGAADIPRSAVVTSTYLGSGQFGHVEQGSWLRPGNVQIPVAIKTLNKGSSKRDKVKFLQEAAIMAQFRHPNVITLHGVVRQGESIMLIVELAHKGDLKQHLSTLKPDPGVLSSPNLSVILLNMSQQVALGMQYLASKGFVHRDLAARNILLSEKMTCKIADFGMSRDLADDTYYVAHGGKIPVKWTAPEAINFKKYSTASDVWSYGCLLYEIWSFGEKPFNTFGNLQVARMVDMGYRLPPPPGCPLRMYDLMINCWHPVASSRPKFLNVCTILAENEKTIFEIPQEALKSDPLAGVLGAPLKAGEHMYQDLQKIYYTEESGSYEHIT